MFWLGMYNFRSLTSRTFIASLLGVATVYWFLLGWCVWQRDFTLFNVPSRRFSKVRASWRQRTEWWQGGISNQTSLGDCPGK
ncbi:MAG: hypothetical protein ACLRS8_06890 [Parabacteroides merdae]